MNHDYNTTLSMATSVCDIICTFDEKLVHVTLIVNFEMNLILLIISFDN